MILSTNVNYETKLRPQVKSQHLLPFAGALGCNSFYLEDSWTKLCCLNLPLTLLYIDWAELWAFDIIILTALANFWALTL